MKTIVREPQQERSIEKKNRIIEAGYQLFSEVGFYGTNTAEIAKRAGVSTGIVYGYFSDKRDILISVLEIYINKVCEPVFALIDELKFPVDFGKIITQILDLLIKTHKSNTRIHETLHSMSGTDEAVNAQFIALEDDITAKFAERLDNIGVTLSNPMEKIHFAMDIIQSFCHEYVFDKHDYIDYAALREMVTQTLINLFSE